MEKEKLLDIKDLSVTYKTEDGIVYAVNNLNLTLEPKETLGFVGETGAGKTTTAMTIMGLLPTPPGKVTSGEIMFDGKDMLKIGDKERRGILGEKISMIFQDPMTYHGPGCDNPGPGHESDQGTERKAGNIHDPDHPRSGYCCGDLR